MDIKPRPNHARYIDIPLKAHHFPYMLTELIVSSIQAYETRSQIRATPGSCTTVVSRGASVSAPAIKIKRPYFFFLSCHFSIVESCDAVPYISIELASNCVLM